MTGRHSGRLHAARLLLKVCVCCMSTHLPGKKNSAACVCECEPASVVITVYFSVCLYLLHWTALHIWQESADPDLSLQTKVNYPPTSPLWLSERATLRGRRKRKGERARVSGHVFLYPFFLSLWTALWQPSLIRLPIALEYLDWIDSSSHSCTGNAVAQWNKQAAH